MRNLKNTALLFIFLIAFLSCKKDHSILGVDVQPENDGVNANYCDTAIVSACTYKYESTASYNDNYKYLGSNQDPVFGRMDVGLYLNANIQNGVTFTTFGADANLVSSEIVLAVSSLYFVGDQTSTLTYSVFALDSALNNARLYFSNNTKLHNKNSLLAVHTTSLSILDGKIVLRIPIDPNYAKSILNNPQYLVDNSTFLSFYKGFYITAAGTNLNPANAQGMITTFNLEDATSGFYLHYQHGTPSATKQDIDYKFNFSGTNALRFNTFSYQPNQSGNADLLHQLNDSTTTLQQNVFLKGLAGTRLKIQIPFLDYIRSYSDSFPIAVNRAEVVFHVDPVLTNTMVGKGLYYVPPKLALLPLDSLGREAYSVDQFSLTDFSRYGGDFDADNNRYVINIARHVQAIINKKKKNYGFHLVVADPNGALAIRRDNYAERVVLAGKDHSSGDLRPKFNLSFIKYKHDK